MGSSVKGANVLGLHVEGHLNNKSVKIRVT